MIARTKPGQSASSYSVEENFERLEDILPGHSFVPPSNSGLKPGNSGLFCEQAVDMSKRTGEADDIDPKRLRQELDLRQELQVRI